MKFCHLQQHGWTWKDKYCMISLILESKKYSKPVNITQKKQTHRYREQTSSYQWREGSGEGHYRDRGLKGTNYYV